MKSTLTTILLFSALIGFGQKKDSTTYSGTLTIGNSSYFMGTRLFGSQVMLGSIQSPNKIEIDNGVKELGHLTSSHKWVISDTLPLLNAMYKDILIRDSLLNKEMERRLWTDRERQLAYQCFLAINSMNTKRVKIALHNYNEFIRTHQ